MDIISATSCIDDVPGFLVSGDDIYFKNVLMDLPLNAVVIEIGSFLGLSAHLMMTIRPDLQMICIDTWSGDAELKKTYEEIPNVYEKFLENMNRLKHDITAIRGNSNEILIELLHVQHIEFKKNNSMADFIFIDGSHQVNVVRRDIEFASLLIKPGKKIAIHDTLDGVAEAIAIFLYKREYLWSFKVYNYPKTNYMSELILKDGTNQDIYNHTNI